MSFAGHGDQWKQDKEKSRRLRFIRRRRNTDWNLTQSQHLHIIGPGRAEHVGCIPSAFATTAREAVCRSGGGMSVSG